MKIIPWQGFENAVIVEGGGANDTIPMHLALHCRILQMIVLVLRVVILLYGIVFGLWIWHFRILSYPRSLCLVLILKWILLNPIIRLVPVYFWSVSVSIGIILSRLPGLDGLLAGYLVVHLDHLVPSVADRVLSSMLLDLRDHLLDHAGAPALHDFLALALDGLEHLVGWSLPTACQDGNGALCSIFGL